MILGSYCQQFISGMGAFWQCQQPTIAHWWAYGVAPALYHVVYGAWWWR